MSEIRVYGVGNPTAELMIVGEAPGVDEVAAGEPFVGKSGHLLDQLLEAAGIERELCWVTNACPIRPPGNDISHFFFKSKREAAKYDQKLFRGCYPHPEIYEGLENLKEEIERVKPKTILAIGGTAMWACTGVRESITSTGILKHRGSTYPCVFDKDIRVISTLHPAFLMRGQQHRRPDVVLDMMRAANPPTPLPKVMSEFYRIFLQDLYRKLSAGNKVMVSVDLETDVESGLILCHGLAYREEGVVKSCIIPNMSVHHTCGKSTVDFNQGNYFSAGEEFSVRQQLARVLTHENVEVCGQYFFAFDWWMYAKWLGFQPKLKWDTYLMQHVYNPGTEKGLNYLSSLYCEEHRYWKDQRKGWDKDAESEQRLWKYCVEDVVRTLEVAENLRKVIEHSQMEEQYQLVLDLAYMSFRMSLRGIRIDVEAREKKKKELKDYRTQLKKQINRITEPHSIFADTEKGEVSSVKCAAYFYDVLQYKPVRTKEGRRTANKEALPLLVQRNPELAVIVQMISEYRSLGTVLSNFLNAGLDPDERMRCVFDVGGTETFRWSSKTNPFGAGANLQNVTEGGSD